MAMILQPGEIERKSFSIIDAELRAQGIVLPEETAAITMRCIHASADFDYAENLCFTPNAVQLAVAALRNGAEIVTDTNMALSGVSRLSLRELGSRAVCFMAEKHIAEQAEREGTTRAVAAMDYAAKNHPHAVFAVGNAPTALLCLADKIEQGLRPTLVIGVPVGFVNVVESKDRIFAVCEQYRIPAIIARGRKGGSSIAAAICNALLYTATERLDPEERLKIK